MLIMNNSSENILVKIDLPFYNRTICTTIKPGYDFGVSEALAVYFFKENTLRPFNQFDSLSNVESITYRDGGFDFKYINKRSPMKGSLVFKFLEAGEILKDSGGELYYRLNGDTLEFSRDLENWEFCTLDKLNFTYLHKYEKPKNKTQWYIAMIESGEEPPSLYTSRLFKDKEDYESVHGHSDDLIQLVPFGKPV